MPSRTSLSTTSSFSKLGINSRAPLRTIVLAGLAGALAEVVWIGLFCALTPLSGGEVLRQITATILPALTGSAWAPALGLLIHFALGVVVAWVFGVLVWRAFARRRGGGTTLAVALLALTAIWAFNFLALLPAVNAEFVGLMPYTVTLGSKVLFGIAMASAFNGIGMKARAGVRAHVHAR